MGPPVERNAGMAGPTHTDGHMLRCSANIDDSSMRSRTIDVAGSAAKNHGAALWEMPDPFQIQKMGRFSVSTFDNFE
jgi:hypothetical protein